MDNDTCNKCMLVEIKALVERLASAKTDEEAEATQKLAVELIDNCSCQDNKQKVSRWEELKGRLPVKKAV